MSSEDVIVFTCHEYTPAEKAEAERFQRELGILGDGLTMREGYATEFPVMDAAQPQTKTKRHDDNKKRKAKLAKASRRRNRR
jgi:hypothetical protein